MTKLSKVMMKYCFMRLNVNICKKNIVFDKWIIPF